MGKSFDIESHGSRKPRREAMAPVHLKKDAEKAEPEESFHATQHEIEPPEFIDERPMARTKKPIFKAIPDDPSELPLQPEYKTTIAWLNIILFAAVLLFASVVGAKIYRQQVSARNKPAAVSTPTALPTLSTATPAAESTANATATPTAMATATPAATPTPTAEAAAATLSKAELKVQVLNGNGRTGEAAVVAGQLKKAGYTNTTAGNARNFQFAKTTVYYQAGRKAEAEAVAELLTSKSPVFEEASITPHVQIVLGKS